MKDIKGQYNLVSVRHEEFYEDIQCLVLFNPPASYLMGWLDERDDNHLLLRISETSVDYSSHKNRYFRFEKQ